MDLYIRKTWAQPDIVVSRIVRFKRKFGPDAFRLACHCSVLPVVSARLVNLININFLEDYNINPIHEANFLLSDACRPVFIHKMYTVEPISREVLLEALQDLPGIPWKRPFEIAEFLWYYLDSSPYKNSTIFPEYWWEYKLLYFTALAYLDPDRGVLEIEEELKSSISPSKWGISGQVICELFALLSDPLFATNLIDTYHDLYINTHLLARIEMEETDGIAKELKGLPSDIKYTIYPEILKHIEHKL